MGAERQYDRAAVLSAFAKYIAETDLPIIAEFSARQGFHKATMYNWAEAGEELAKELLELCTTKKEAALERGCLEGNLTPAMAIFSLKQMGWTDRNDVTVKGDKAHPLALTHADGKL